MLDGPKEPPALPSPTPASLPPPTPPRVERYRHPELRALSSGSHVNHGKIVCWAIQRMTENFSLKDIAALLEREGYPLGGAAISVVLTRLKRQGKIGEVEPGRGPIPAVFRIPQEPTPEETKARARMSRAERELDLAQRQHRNRLNYMREGMGYPKEESSG